MKRALYLTGILLLVQSFFYVPDVQGQTEKKRTQKISTNDSYKYIAINDILMWVSNNGDGSHDPRTDGSGFYWPGGELATKSAIFEDGLVYGGKVNGQIRVNGNTHRQGLQAGKILSPGIADDPSLAKYRVYRIRKDWKLFPEGDMKEQLKKDYDEWPVEDGAPWVDVNGDGVFTRDIDEPKFEGDEVLWYVANDLDSSRTHFTYGSDPIGLEFQTTVFGYFADSSNILGNVIFKKYKIINKSNELIEDMYFSYWADDDVGDPADDYTGCDTTLLMGYVYNGDNDDGGGAGSTYGTPPPAVAHIFIQTPITQGTLQDSAFYNSHWVKGFYNIGMTSFIPFVNAPGQPWRDPQQGIYEGTLEMYNYMRGKLWDGSDIIDPTTNLATSFIYAGNPIDQTGWYDGTGWHEPPSSDRRFLMTSGSVNMAPGDTNEVVIAILISKGSDNKNSLVELKRDASLIRTIFNQGFDIKPELTSPQLNAFSDEGKIVLSWTNEVENFEEPDITTFYQGLADSTYTFEGYKVWQYSDSLGSNPKLLNIFDIENDIINVKDFVLLNGQKEYITVLISPNQGLTRHIEITEDKINQRELYDGSPYYFGVTAYAYSPNGFKKIIESEPKILTIIPGKRPIDITYYHEAGDTIHFIQVIGKSDVPAKLVVIDPTALTGDTYEIVFRDSAGIYLYTFYNKTTGDTLLINSKDFSASLSEKNIYDGFILIIDLPDQFFYQTQKIKNIVEVKGPAGVELNEPQSVFEELNSTGKWKIVHYDFQGITRSIQYINYLIQMSDDDFEIRFTTLGSEYYTTGYNQISPTLRNDPKGKNRVPFEVWSINRETGDEERLFIKIMDNSLINRDTSWSQDPLTSRWESLYAYTKFDPYHEPLSVMSGTTNTPQHKFGHLSILGELPAEGTVIRINTIKPPQTGDIFSAVATAPTRDNFENAKQNIDQITIFPNPYFGSSTLEAGGIQRIVRMTNLPNNVIVRIYSIAGVFIKRIDKDNPSPWLDWDLRNEDGSLIGSGVYLLYLDMPGIGTKIMKLAVVQSN